MDLSGQPMAARASGAAQRRKLGRLRAALRHEQQSIAVTLASAFHHSADKTTRAQHNAPWGQRNAGTEYNELSDEDEVLARGSQPPCLGEPQGPQDQDQLRTVEQTADHAPVVQILDTLVPQMVDQLVAYFHTSILWSPSRLSPCPRSHGHPAFRVRFSASRRRRNSWWKRRRILSLVRVFEQTVDIQLAQVVVPAMEATKVFSQDRVLLSLSSRS